MADCLGAWASAWDSRFVVVDTHPGANPLTDGAMSVADLIVVPVVLAAREMDGLARMLDDWSAYGLLLVPNRVPPIPPRRWVEALGRLAGDIPVAPPVSEHRWLARRVRRAALTLQPNPGRAVAKAAAELVEVASAVGEGLCLTPTASTDSTSVWLAAVAPCPPLADPLTVPIVPASRPTTASPPNPQRRPSRRRTSPMIPTGPN